MYYTDTVRIHVLCFSFKHLARTSCCSISLLALDIFITIHIYIYICIHIEIRWPTSGPEVCEIFALLLL